MLAHVKEEGIKQLIIDFAFEAQVHEIANKVIDAMHIYFRYILSTFDNHGVMVPETVLRLAAERAVKNKYDYFSLNKLFSNSSVLAKQLVPNSEVRTPIIVTLADKLMLEETKFRRFVTARRERRWYSS